MPSTTTHFRRRADELTAADVRFALALWGYEAGAVRVRAVTNKLAEVGMSEALIWAFSRTKLEVARDIRMVSGALAYSVDDIRRIIANTATSVDAATRFDCPDRLRVHDRAAAELVASVTAEAA